jgi:GNAT superfamily N-acetyltransferase
MQSQVAGMFSAQYGVDPGHFSRLMNDFYDHPYQKDKCIRVVALDGKKVIGFQSFFYWPYTFNGKTFNSYQSGNSLVHPDARGKGIFQKLLGHIDEHKEQMQIDFLMGFPVEESRKSFLRNNWENILDLRWYVKPVNPFSILFGEEERRLSDHFDEKYPEAVEYLPGQFRLSSDPGFCSWRKAYSGKRYYHVYEQGDHRAVFSLKFNRRRSFLRELIIGDIRSSSYEASFIREALRDLLRATRKSKCITLLTLALNERSRSHVHIRLKENGFRPVSKSIYFIVKPFAMGMEILEPANWCIYRSDIDTW